MSYNITNDYPGNLGMCHGSMIFPVYFCQSADLCPHRLADFVNHVNWIGAYPSLLTASEILDVCAC